MKILFRKTGSRMLVFVKKTRVKLMSDFPVVTENEFDAIVNGDPNADIIDDPDGVEVFGYYKGSRWINKMIRPESVKAYYANLYKNVRS